MVGSRGQKRATRTARSRTGESECSQRRRRRSSTHDPRRNDETRERIGNPHFPDARASHSAILGSRNRHPLLPSRRRPHRGPFNTVDGWVRPVAATRSTGTRAAGCVVGGACDAASDAWRLDGAQSPERVAQQHPRCLRRTRADNVSRVDAADVAEQVCGGGCGSFRREPSAPPHLACRPRHARRTSLRRRSGTG